MQQCALYYSRSALNPPQLTAVSLLCLLTHSICTFVVGPLFMGLLLLKNTEIYWFYDFYPFHCNSINDLLSVRARCDGPPISFFDISCDSWTCFLLLKYCHFYIFDYIHSFDIHSFYTILFSNLLPPLHEYEPLLLCLFLNGT